MKCEIATRFNRFARVFGWPILLAIVGVIGLISALAGNGIWDALSWGGLSGSILVIVWHVVRQAR
jgi:hypothetical protein